TEPKQRPKLLILNQPISNFQTFERLWHAADYRVCADGGANRLWDMLGEGGEGGEGRRENFLPDVIHGDLDSLRDDVRDYYAARRVTVSRDPDQESTDFGKAVGLLKQAFASDEKARAAASTNPPDSDIIILSTLAGRIDQGLGLLHELYRTHLSSPFLRLWLFSERSVTFLLLPGQHTLHDLVSSNRFTENVGIVPLFGPARISTRGLEWDVKDWETQMGGRVSTSNHVRSEEVVVGVEGAVVLFTIELA
ncbi:thiamine pyrophosphokinase, partial [Aulographum hederae CBS 113979]